MAEIANSNGAVKAGLAEIMAFGETFAVGIWHGIQHVEHG